MHGFGGNNDIKTEQMIETIKEMIIGMMMINDKNCKWSTKTIDELRIKLGRVSKDVNMKTSNSKEHELRRNDYIQGGALTSAFGKLSICVAESTKKKISWGNGTRLN